MCVSTKFDDLPEEVIVNILSFIPGRDLLTTVSLVSQKLNRLVNELSLWNHVKFYHDDSPRYIAALLARFKMAIRSVFLASTGVAIVWKIRRLRESKIDFEEIELCTDHIPNLDLTVVFQLLSESTKILSVHHPGNSNIRLPPNGQGLPKTNLTSLVLDADSCVNDNVIEAIVASCPELELLKVGEDAHYTDVGLRAIANGLPNLISLFLNGSDNTDESIQYLLSRKPGLAAFSLIGTWGTLPRTAAQISQMRNLQYIRLWKHRLDGGTIQAMFRNANFGQLKTLLLEDVDKFDGAALKTMAMACPNLEQLALCWTCKVRRREEDEVIKYIATSCPELRVFCIEGSKAITGKGWLNNIATLLPRCLVVSCNDRLDLPSCQLYERGRRARLVNPKLCVLIGMTPHWYNKKAMITGHEVWWNLRDSPRPCDLKAQRVRCPNLLHVTARDRLAALEHNPNLA